LVFTTPRLALALLQLTFLITGNATGGASESVAVTSIAFIASSRAYSESSRLSSIAAITVIAKATLMLVSSTAFAPSSTVRLSAVMAHLGYVGYLTTVVSESLVISPLTLLSRDLDNVAVHAVYIYFINVPRYDTIVAVVVVVSFIQLFHSFLVDCQLIDQLNLSGEVTAVLMGDLVGDQLL
jgi:hypothetical protein